MQLSVNIRNLSTRSHTTASECGQPAITESLPRGSSFARFFGVARVLLTFICIQAYAEDLSLTLPDSAYKGDNISYSLYCGLDESILLELKIGDHCVFSFDCSDSRDGRCNVSLMQREGYNCAALSIDHRYYPVYKTKKISEQINPYYSQVSCISGTGCSNNKCLRCTYPRTFCTMPNEVGCARKKCPDGHCVIRTVDYIAYSHISFDFRMPEGSVTLSNFHCKKNTGSSRTKIENFVIEDSSSSTITGINIRCGEKGNPVLTWQKIDPVNIGFISVDLPGQIDSLIRPASETELQILDFMESRSLSSGLIKLKTIFFTREGKKYGKEASVFFNANSCN